MPQEVELMYSNNSTFDKNINNKIEQMADDGRLVEYALQYQQIGFFILPLIPGKKRPYVSWADRRDSRPDEKEIRTWWKKYPNAQIGAATGKYSGIDVIDFDNSSVSIPHFESVVCDLPDTFSVNSGRLEGGQHIYFKHNGFNFKNIAKPKDKYGQAIDVDVRTTGGIIVLPPSRHKSGNHYKWGNLNPLDMDDWQDELQDMPKEIAAFFETASGANGTDNGSVKLDLEQILSGIGHGERDILLFKYCCRLRGKNLEYAEAKAMVINLANNCDPPFSEKDAVKKLDQAWGYEPGFIKVIEQPPLLLEREMEKADPYPMEALGEIIGEAAKIMTKGIQAPDALCAHSVLGFATHSVQGHANVFIDGRTIPLNEFFLSIGSRSARKTECDSKAGQIHKSFQKELFNQYQIDREVFMDEQEAYKREKDKIIKNDKKSLSEKNDALAVLRKNQPLPPHEPLIVFSDPTTQGIHGLFMNGTPSKYLCADEGGQVSGGHSMKPEEKTYTATTFSKWWDGAPIDRVRGGDGSSILYGRRLSMHLMMQDKIAAAFFNDEVMRNQGLLSRFLCSFPISLTGHRFYQEYNVSDTVEMLNFYNRVQRILDEPLPLRTDEKTGLALNELEPRTIYLEDNAKKAWIVAYEAIETESGKGRTFESIEGFAGKASNHIIRLAGIMAMFDDITRESVPKEYIDNAIILMEYYLNERMRLTRMAEPNLSLEHAKKLLRWIQEKKLKTVTLPDVYQFGPNRFRNKKQAQDVIRVLEEHFWLVRLKVGGTSEISSKKSNDIWQVNDGEI